MSYSVAAVGGARDLLDWRDLEIGAPEIARLGAARLDSARVAMIGTVRPDGSQGISPIERHIADGHLLAGAMTWSAKASDLRRDPRYTLHSSVTGPDSDEGELKLRRLAVRADADLRIQATDSWWSAQPSDKAIVFLLRIGQALFVGWDIPRGEMTVHRWSPSGGYRRTARTYP